MKPLGAIQSEPVVAEACPAPTGACGARATVDSDSANSADSAAAPSPEDLQESHRLLPGPVCVDTHAHLHPVFDLESALQAALGHARRAAAGTCVLCLTRGLREPAFDHLRATGFVGSLRFEAAPGDPAVLVSRGGMTRPSLVLVDGRQLVSAENIEVLALAVPADAVEGLPSGLSLEKTLSAVTETGAVAVLPHGVGKWIGRRGQLVSRAIDLAAGAPSQAVRDRFGGRRLCVADNAGRFTLGPRPAIFDQAAALGLTVLAGSDPLPLRRCSARLGGLGVQLEAGIEPDRIGETLRRELPKLGPSARRFGGHAGLLRSATEQAALRMLGRSRKRSAGRAA